MDLNKMAKDANKRVSKSIGASAKKASIQIKKSFNEALVQNDEAFWDLALELGVLREYTQIKEQNVNL